MAVNIIMEKSTFTGRDSSGKEHYRAVLLADTTDELPTREWNGIVLEQGSSITSIGEGAEYMMNSAGAWVRQGGGAPEPTLIEKSIAANGEYDPADDDADGYSSVSVSVSPTLENKSVTPTTSEQTITAGENYDGLGTVTVEAVTAAIDSDIVAGNIKKDVEILGVTGSYEGSGGGGNAVVGLENQDGAEGYFSGIGNVTSLSVPEGIIYIDNEAGNTCSNLTSLTLPSTLEIIGYNSFPGTLIQSLVIPDSVTEINDYAFSSNTSLTSLRLPHNPNSVTIYPEAFNGCEALETLDIPDNTVFYDENNNTGNQFSNCTSLTTVTIGANCDFTNSDSVFYSCDALTSITVNANENDPNYVGAPWGADNATVTWTG